MIQGQQRLTENENVDPQGPPMPATNATNHLNMVDTLVKKADKQIDEERNLIDLLRQQLQAMKAKIQNCQLDILNTLKPAIEGCCQELGMAQLQQKEDNINFQSQITELKKEKSLMNQMISQSNQLTTNLFSQVGGY